MKKHHQQQIQRRKLQLRTETIRLLDRNKLEQVFGGSDSYPPDSSCESCTSD